MSTETSTPSPPRPRILVLGSLNLDLVLHVPRLPMDGETLASDRSGSFCGGKGANQAVACARLGALVSMIGRVGDDPAGVMLRTALGREGVALEGVIKTPGTASGVAIILLTPDGQNRIVLAGGANARLSPEDVSARSAEFDAASLLVCQLESPIGTVGAAIEQAARRGIPVLLNPAPAHALPSALLALTDYVIPNETEASALTGIAIDSPESAGRAARVLLRQGAGHVVITMGAAGILIADRGGSRHMPALPAEVVDTTAAGDSFIGGFATGIVEGLDIDAAARLGLAAAQICVSRAGAQASMPHRSELLPP